jgi:hypothetical protein
MARPVGRPPKPTEQKRRLGNPGKRKLPSAEVAIVGQVAAPEPVRPLGQVGLAFWQRVWAIGFAWISPQTDIELLQMVCEQIDERQALRVRVLRDGDWRDRTALRALDAQVLDCLSLLGFTPVDRARLGFVEVKIQNELDAYRERKAKSGGRAAKVVDVGEAKAD